MEILEKLVTREDLTENEAELVMESIVSGHYTSAQAAALLIALKIKGENRDEIAAFARVMRRNMLRIAPKCELLVDSCGTGGDSSYTFNISTTAAFIAAGAGVHIAKHGNKSISSKCGSADVLEQLGAKMLPPEKVERCIEETGIGFMFAPLFHPAIKNVMGLRRELGIRTVFNILGPLTNPANAQAQLLGVFDPTLTETFAMVLGSLGTRKAFVVHSEGMDEIGLGKTKVTALEHGRIETYFIDAEEFGFEKKKVPTSQSREESARIMLNVLYGERGSGRDISLMNAAALIYIGGKAKTMSDGIELAKDSIDSGSALKKLYTFINFRGEGNGHPRQFHTKSAGEHSGRIL